MYIVFEGLVRSGKTTHSKLLLKYLQKKFPKKEVVLTREPGGTEISENIRKLVQATKYEEDFLPITDTYLYASSRAHSLRKIVKPVLDANGIVIADRSFITSLAWQGYGLGLGLEKVLSINKDAIEGFIPDVVFYLDIEPEIALSRGLDKEGDKWESMSVEFFNKAREGYLELKDHKMFKKKFYVIDANDGVEDRIQTDIRDILEKV